MSAQACDDVPAPLQDEATLSSADAEAPTEEELRWMVDDESLRELERALSSSDLEVCSCSHSVLSGDDVDELSFYCKRMKRTFTLSPSAQTFL